MQYVLCERGSEPFLIQELQRAFPHGTHRVCTPGLVASDFPLLPEAAPTLVFSRQLMPEAIAEQAASIKDWAQRLLASLTTRLPEGQPWQLHIVPHYGSGPAGLNRCRLIREALLELLQRKCRHLLRTLEPKPTPLTPSHSLVQLLLTAPEQGLLSTVVTPVTHQLRRLVSPFPKGEVAVASDPTAPSRAFAKLLEAEQRLGLRISAGDRCVDLGASPGSWCYVALNRGAHVLAVDRAPLRADLMSHPQLSFQKGDAFNFRPEAPVDWLLCDVIAAPMRSVELLLQWARQRWAARFVVTVKFKGTEDYGLLERVKYALPPLCDEFCLTHLCANKNEVCAFGVMRKVRT